MRMLIIAMVLFFLVGDLITATSLSSLGEDNIVKTLTKEELADIRNRISYKGSDKFNPEILSDENLKKLLNGEPLLIIGPKVWEFAIKNTTVVTKLTYQINYIYKLDKELALTMKKNMIGPTKIETLWWATILVGLILALLLFFIIAAAVSDRPTKK